MKKLLFSLIIFFTISSLYAQQNGFVLPADDSGNIYFSEVVQFDSLKSNVIYNSVTDTFTNLN